MRSPKRFRREVKPQRLSVVLPSKIHHASSHFSLSLARLLSFWWPLASFVPKLSTLSGRVVDAHRRVHFGGDRDCGRHHHGNGHQHLRFLQPFPACRELWFDLVLHWLQPIQAGHCPRSATSRWISTSPVVGRGAAEVEADRSAHTESTDMGKAA